MINNIFPHKFDNTYKNEIAQIGDYILCYKDNHILLKEENKKLVIPRVEKNIKARYLFSIDEEKFFLVEHSEIEIDDKFCFYPVGILREFEPEYLAYAGICGRHIATFAHRSRYCGVCGEETVFSNTEQAVVCPKCNNTIYPCIMPAVIVGITYEDKVLLTKYAKGTYQNYALVAGYVEFGETLEEAVIREVKEEVGLDVYDVKYYKSQPWGFSNTLMIGYFAKAKNDKITLQLSELKEATWFAKSEINEIKPNISLGHEMILKMKNE